MQSPSLLTRSPVVIGSSGSLDELSKPNSFGRNLPNQEQQWRAKVLEAGAGMGRGRLGDLSVA